MRSKQIFGFSGLLGLLLVSLIPLVGINQASAKRNAPIVDIVTDCADATKDCKSPVKYLGEKDGCACFACEFGKPTQRIICTANQDDKNKLMAQSRVR
ncbi:MAG TPA: hypothetical protein VKB46_08710 [Pyrinomonadaceae bacterium]|nr:hypothetical protein [Pyrinomonadaceae bacterium]